MSYSPYDVVSDGPLSAPRWLHHLFKLMTHMSVAFLLLVCGLRFQLAALIAGPGLYVVIQVKEMIWPSDSDQHTRWQRIADVLTDGALASVPVAGALLAEHDALGGALEREAKEKYPLPVVTVPRVVMDPSGVLFRLVDGVLEFEFETVRHGEWQRVHGHAAPDPTWGFTDPEYRKEFAAMLLEPTETRLDPEDQ